MRRVLPVILILSVSLLPTISYGGVETGLIVSLADSTSVDEKLTKKLT
jgi:hypothetical protein